jgi:HEAT repeat protein
MKPLTKAIWRFCLAALLIILLLWVSVPWQRLKVPILIQLARHGPAGTRSLAEMFLGHAEGDPNMVVPVLLDSLQDKNVSVRETVALSLGNIHQFPERVVPALMAEIRAEPMESLAPMYGYRAIGCFGTNAKAWSPMLVQIIESNRFGYWSSSARSALVKIDPEVGQPLVEQYFTDASNRVKQAEIENAEKQQRKAPVTSNPPPAKP